MRDLPRSVCFCKLCQPALDTKDFTSGMKSSLWGARLMALPSTFACLGAYVFETFLRSACLECLGQTPCSHAGYLGVSTLHTFKINDFIVDCFNHYRRLLHSTRLSRPCWVFSDTGHCCLRPLRDQHAYQGLLEVGPARLLAAMLGDLGVSTLCSIKTMTQFSSLSGASNQPCCLLQCSGTTLRVRLRCPLVFYVVPTCWETRFSTRRYSTYFFFSSSFLDHHADHPTRHDTRIVLMSASSMPSGFFLVVSIY
jgi:hypothetical protein